MCSWIVRACPKKRLCCRRDGRFATIRRCSRPLSLTGLNVTIVAGRGSLDATPIPENVTVHYDLPGHDVPI